MTYSLYKVTKENVKRFLGRYCKIYTKTYLTGLSAISLSDVKAILNTDLTVKTLSFIFNFLLVIIAIKNLCLAWCYQGSELLYHYANSAFWMSRKLYTA